MLVPESSTEPLVVVDIHWILWEAILIHGSPGGRINKGAMAKYSHW